MIRDRSLRIAILSEDFPPWTGGIAQWAYGIASSLGRMGHEVTVCAKKKSVKNSNMHDRASYRVVTMGGTQWKYLRALYSGYYATKLYLEKPRFDLIISTTWNIAMAPAFLFRGTPVKTIVVAHGLEVTRNMSDLRLRLLAYTLRHSTMTVAVSRFTRDRIMSRIGLNPDQTVVIPNGVDLNRFYRIQGKNPLRTKLGLLDKKVILTLARIIERKGHDMMIRALPRVLEKYPNTLYLIAGRGRRDVIEGLKSLSRELGLTDRVLFTGYVEDAEMNYYYNLCDVYVMVSRELTDKGDTEGFGITYLEANSCGKPVIGGNSGGVSDAIAHGQTGFLVDPEDVSQLTDKLLLLLSNPELADRLGRQGLERAQKFFTWDHAVTRLLETVGL
ncbi:MAG: hypothetical protein B6244_07335 [Candidatus Cloacimonetes bacterium 4572_55]|nr:MAG: hypothetical protein B6244_07335 [Candidatus Cloacimonetes bacterium 4572_55]